jgi:hypothetical protein
MQLEALATSAADVSVGAAREAKQHLDRFGQAIREQLLQGTAEEGLPRQAAARGSR